MRYTTFNQHEVNPLKEPMFFGEAVNVARYDQQRHAIFEKLIEKQLSFFWRPEEVDVSRDRADFQSMTDSEKHIFISNLKYQTLLDSIQGRSPNVAFTEMSPRGGSMPFVAMVLFTELLKPFSITCLKRLTTWPKSKAPVRNLTKRRTRKAYCRSIRTKSPSMNTAMSHFT